MEILQEGEGELVGWHDPDENRQWVLENKSRELTDKRMSVKDAVGKFVRDSDYVAVGGFGHVRTPMALIYEIVRQKRRNLTVAGKTAVHDLDVLIGGGCVAKVEAAYSFGHELRGLSACGRRAVESGQCQVVSEISNAGYQWRFLAGMMGVPFITGRTMLGTDTFRKSACKVARDPWSGKPICLIPAAYPDVAMFHVPRCDMYGNAQIDGIMIEDFELCRAARRVIVTTEKIIENNVIRDEPGRTAIPFLVVDAVCEVPYGAHPCQMPYLYGFDEEHMAEWFEVSKTVEGTEHYMEKYVHKTRDFAEYLQRIGGREKIRRLEQAERSADN